MHLYNQSNQLAIICIYIYLIWLCLKKSKNGYGSLRGDPDVWNEGATQMISNEFHLFKRVWIGGMDRLWVHGMDRDLTF